MQCTRPLDVEGRRVPCGRCASCKANRAAEWSMRLMNEMGSWNESVFGTLTYDDGHIPVKGTLVKAHLQNYFKGVRNDVKRPFRYYGVGEYGERTQRPHYHFIGFGFGVDDVGVLGDRWNMGHAMFGDVNMGSIRYVCNYVQKKLYGEAKERTYGDRLAPFSIMSKGMGRFWMEENVDHILQNGGIRYQGCVRRIPRYYVKKLCEVLTDDWWNNRFIERMQEKLRKEALQDKDPLKAWKRDEDGRLQIEAEQAFWERVRAPKL